MLSVMPMGSDVQHNPCTEGRVLGSVAAEALSCPLVLSAAPPRGSQLLWG